MYEKGNNKRMMAISMNNLGNVYKHLAKYETAVSSYQNAIRLAEEVNDPTTWPCIIPTLVGVY